jgi:transcriptional regulator with XRE-family HTH domain
MTSRKNQPERPSPKVPLEKMSEIKRLDAVAEFSDDVISKLTDAFFEVVSREGWTKRDLADISGLNETMISHVLSGRRLNPTIETVALLARAMRKRPKLNLEDARPTGNQYKVEAGTDAPPKSYPASEMIGSPPSTIVIPPQTPKDTVNERYPKIIPGASGANARVIPSSDR